MKQVNIINEVDLRQFGAKMEDPTAWIAECVANNSWGLPERELEYIPEGYESRVTKEETRTRYNPITEQDEEYTVYTLKADYVITEEDITTAYEKEQAVNTAIAAGRVARQCCADIYDYIGAMIDPYTPEQIDTFISTYSDLMQLIQIGRPVAAKSVIATLEPTALLTQEMLDGVNAIITKYGF